MTTIYTQERFYFMTLDPVHIGAGGYRLGCVDNAIARELGCAKATVRALDGKSIQTPSPSTQGPYSSFVPDRKAHD